MMFLSYNNEMKIEKTGAKFIAPGFLQWAGKIVVRRTLFVFFCAASYLVGNGVSITATEWRNHTNVNAAYDLQPSGDSIWTATSGGLLFFAGGNVRTFTNADGLGENDLLFVTLDSSGRVWTGGRGGRLSSLDPQSGEWVYFDFIDRDGRSLRLSAAATDGDLLWVASNVGVHKFDTEHFGGEITETYRRFGDLPADEPVNDVEIVADLIWVATGAGCAVARTDDINLQDFSHWRSFSDDNSGLAAENVAALAEDDGIIYAATDDGLYMFTVTGPDSVWSLVPDSETEFFDLFQAENRILAATADGVMSCTAEGCSVLPAEGMADAKSRAVCQTPAGVVWAASYNELGFSIYDGSTWADSTVAGIASNTVHDLAVSPGGKLWASHPSKPTSMWDGSTWELFDSLTGGPAINCLAVDHEGCIWFGTHGGGATRYNPAEPDSGYQSFDETNSPLRGTEPPPDDWYVVVSDIVVDDSGRVWLANTFDYDDRVLVFYDHGCWGYFGTGDGFPPVEPISLFPLTNELLVGFDEDGLADFEFDSTVSLCIEGSQVPQIPKIILMDDTDGLPTRQVRCLLVDVAREVWAGTSGGLAYFDRVWGRFRTFSLGDIPAPTINALVADGGNNIWVGADEGLFVIEPNGQVTHYTPNNSGLANENVSSLAIDESTNTLWVGTAGGISEFISATESATPVEEIIAYPNPFIISRGNEKLTFDAAFGTTIQIYTAAGELVKDIGQDTEWYGRNEAYKLVASGVYVFVAVDANGHYGRGKFVVIRQ